MTSAREITSGEIYSALEGALLAKPGALSLEDTLVSVGWDSMAVVAFVGEMSDRHGLALSVDEIAGCDTVGDLLAAVHTRAKSP